VQITKVLYSHSWKKLLDIDPDCTIRLCDTVDTGVPFPEVDEPYGIPYMVKRLREIGTKISKHIFTTISVFLLRIP